MQLSPAPKERTPCPLCRTFPERLEFPRARGPARAHPLVRCDGCGLVFQKHLPDLTALDAAQSDAYGAPQKRFTGLVEAGIRLLRLARVRKAMALLLPGGSTLDIGCGRGLYLQMLKERGYEVRGSELSTATATNALPGIPIDTGEVEPGRYPDGSFDLISIWHVLEHLRFPDVTLSACARALKPGGALLIAVPNYGSLQAKLGGEEWFHLDLPRHIFHFTHQTLEALLTRHGFEIESLRTGQWEMDPFGLLQTTLNRLGLRHNALYDSLRSNPRVRQDLSPAVRRALWALFPAGLALAAPMSLLFRLLGRAGTLQAVARKR